MNGLQISVLVIMAVFYIAYFTKMLLQRKKGIQTDQIGKGSKSRKILFVELLMKIATLGIVPVEVVSILGEYQLWNNVLCQIGAVISSLGVAVFILAMYTMHDSWRAGIPALDKTELVTNGIYRFSRNPAFLGFDLLYVGILLAFFNWVHLVAVIYAIVMLHLQILQEEVYLVSVFGDDYLAYKKRTGRYFLI